MKRTITLIFCLFCAYLINSQNINNRVEDATGSPMLLGQINKVGLTKEPFKNWFNKNYNGYMVNNQIVSTVEDTLKNYNIKIFLGTWCGDSRRQVPRFYKVLEAAKFPENQLEVIALNRDSNAYKQSPTGEERGLNVHRVPTFIFYKDGEEVNRIVESPKATFENDIMAILEGKYTPNYMAANYLEGLIRTKGIDSLMSMEGDLVSRLSDFVKGSRELNTLGYVKLSAQQFDEALFVFQINTKIFPYKPNVYDSLGEAYLRIENHQQALANYQKVLQLKPKDKNAIQMIEKIKSTMKK